MTQIIYIGDRAVGKTSLAAELARPEQIAVTVTDLSFEVSPQPGKYAPTTADTSLHERSMALQVALPSGYRRLDAAWIDTPGEVWRKRWQEDNPEQWQSLLGAVRQSQGILLILPPYREMLNLSPDEAEAFITRAQWCRRFQRWAEFFRINCPKVQHLVLCLNKADLFTADLGQESGRLAYWPERRGSTWQEKHQYVESRYFAVAKDSLKQLNTSVRGLSVRCFITSIHDRGLLELPWVYLASYLGR